MKKHLLFALWFLLFQAQLLFGQESFNVIRLNSGGTVINTIIHKNPHQSPVSNETSVMYSVSDSVMHGPGNPPPLVASPFAPESFGIYLNSPAYNAGTLQGLRSSDTLDLDFNPRVSCADIDIGAFEFQVITTKITVQPQSKTVCEGTPIVLSVEAEGANISYQWQKNGINLSEENQSDLQLFGTLSDNGSYRVIVFGDCCNDTSVLVQVAMDIFSVFVMSDNGCHNGDGWASVSAEGESAPYTFLWNNGSTDSLITDLTLGVYTVSVTSIYGNTISETIEITEASELMIDWTAVEPSNKYCNDGSIKTTVRGGIPDYTYIWDDDFGSIGTNLLNVSAGVYSLTVTDARGCEKTADIPLPCSFTQVMPTLYISPNDDGKNDVLKIKNIENYPNNKVVIFNSYGEEITTLRNYDNINQVWDGKNSKGQVLPDGVYYYIIEAYGTRAVKGWLLMKTSKTK